MRTRKNAAKAAPTPPNTVANEVIDAWRVLRTTRAATTVGYSTIADLYADFSAWHEATYPDVALPTENAFAIAVTGIPKIIIATLRVSVGGGIRNASCASLTLNRAIRAFAA